MMMMHGARPGGGGLCLWGAGGLAGRRRLAALVAALVLGGAAGRVLAETAPALETLGSNLQAAVSEGDFVFSLDALAVRPAPAGGAVRVLVQLPLRDFLLQTKANQADLRLRARAFAASTAVAAATAAGADADSLRDRTEAAEAALEAQLARFEETASVADAETRVKIESADRNALRDIDFRVLELTLDVPAGDHVVQVVAENLSRKKRGLLDRVRRRPLAATARMLVRVPDFSHEPVLTDPLFEFGHGQHAVYPARLYGLLNDSLHVRTALFAHGAYTVRASAADRDGRLAWQDSQQVEVAGSRELVWRASVNTLAAGQYMLRVTATGVENGTAAARGFDVAWSMVTWLTSRRDLDAEAELALTEEAYEQYRTLPLGEKERVLESFWHGLDPTPNTAQNEVHDEFNRRVAYANLHYSESVRGSQTDRGRVYIHFGVPDELHAEAVPSHLAGKGAEEALDKVDDVFVAAEHPKNSTLDPELQGSGSSEDPRSRASERTQEYSRVVGSGNEVAGYELWIYKGAGNALLPQDKAITFDTGLRVLFVDVTGYGEYRLRKSSVRLDIHGLSQSF
jgi:GWxTD domain-containing protein